MKTREGSFAFQLDFNVWYVRRDFRVVENVQWQDLSVITRRVWVEERVNSNLSHCFDSASNRLDLEKLISGESTGIYAPLDAVLIRIDKNDLHFIRETFIRSGDDFALEFDCLRFNEELRRKSFTRDFTF